MDIVENSSFQHLRHTPKDGRFRNAVKIFLAVYARKWTDSLNPKKFNCGGGHICPKVKTPYGQKRRGEPSGARAPPTGRAKAAAQPPRRPTGAPLSPCTIFRARRTPCRAAFCSPLLRPAGRVFSERSSQICALE